MRSKLQVVRWKNLLSSGNSWNEVQLDEHPLTLIVGENGAGKSTMIEAIFYAWTGKPFRNIVKGNLVNSINQKGLLVELEWMVGQHHYMVRRGQKPSIFEIYKDDELVPQDASAGDYQAILDRLRGQTHKSLGQVMILGSGSYVPFMKLQAHQRREFVEDLLDVRVFSAMAKILKSKMDVNKEQLAKNSSERGKVASVLEVLYRQRDSRDKKNNKKIDELTAEIYAMETNLEESQREIDEKVVQRQNRLDIVESLNHWQDHARKLDGFRNTLEAEARRINKDLKFYIDLPDCCPSCRQAVSPELREKMKQQLRDELQGVNDKIEKLNPPRQEAASFLIDRQANEIAASQLDKEIGIAKVKHSNIQNAIAVATREATDLMREVEKDDTSEQIKIKEEDLSVLDADELKLFEESRTYKIAQSFLKDDGIKASVISQYIPTINHLVNKYLQEMDFFVEFELDEGFNEKILSRHRDNFSYESFSEGEKLRIDLALMFAWRDVARMRSTASINLLIMDEVMDSSLDATGADDFLKILRHQIKDTNAFVISHRGDQLIDKFPMVIEFKKVGNFSERVA